MVGSCELQQLGMCDEQSGTWRLQPRGRASYSQLSAFDRLWISVIISHSAAKRRCLGEGWELHSPGWAGTQDRLSILENEDHPRWTRMNRSQSGKGSGDLFEGSPAVCRSPVLKHLPNCHALMWPRHCLVCWVSQAYNGPFQQWELFQIELHIQ